MFSIIQISHCLICIRNPIWVSFLKPRNTSSYNMAEGASNYFFLCLLFVLTFCSSEVFPRKEIEQKGLTRQENQVFAQIPHRELLDHFHYKTTLHDTVYPPLVATTSPTNPVTIPPENNPTPTIVTVPSTLPVTVTPTSNPVTIPSTTPVPITNPVTTPTTGLGTQPITNPVTTYPAPTTGVPVTTPVTNPAAPTTGTPAVSGQSWCVVKSGAPESALQAALDYACGIGGADCSVIQQSGGCYNPNTLENHASFAFNSYYQKNPVQTSCDFGGTAVITNMDPSSGTCIYPSSATSSSSPMTATTPSPTTTSSSTGATVPGSGSPPSVLNTNNPGLGSSSGFGESPPTYPSYNNSTSMATSVQPFLGCIVLVTSFVTGRVILNL